MSPPRATHRHRCPNRDIHVRSDRPKSLLRAGAGARAHGGCLFLGRGGYESKPRRRPDDVAPAFERTTGHEVIVSFEAGYVAGGTTGLR